MPLLSNGAQNRPTARNSGRVALGAARSLGRGIPKSERCVAYPMQLRRLCQAQPESLSSGPGCRSAYQPRVKQHVAHYRRAQSHQQRTVPHSEILFNQCRLQVCTGWHQIRRDLSLLRAADLARWLPVQLRATAAPRHYQSGATDNPWPSSGGAAGGFRAASTQLRAFMNVALERLVPDVVLRT